MNHLLRCAMVVVVFFGLGFARKVQIELDYTNLPCWSYVMDYKSDCVIIENNGQSSIKTNVVCGMTARPLFLDRGRRLEFTMDSIAVISELYTPQQRENIINKLTGARFGLALFGGCPVVDTMSTFTVSELSEWDMVIQFAKLLPFIPVRKVRKGYSWEESSVYPLMTSMGKVPCEVYRLYQIDSISAKNERVYISWKFNYGAMKKAMPDSSILKKVPINGKGTGNAVIDIPMKTLVQATVEFRTPVATYGETNVIWVENTTLRVRPEVICNGETK